MSNLSINNAVPMNNDFRSQVGDMPSTNKLRETLLTTNTANPISRDNGVIVKENNVTVSKDALEKLFEMFESVFKAIRSMLASQGGMPKLTLDAVPLPKAGPLDSAQKPKVASETRPQPKVEPAPGPKVGPKADLQSKATPQSDVLKLLPGLVPEVRPDPDRQNKAMSDVNVTVQINNCHCPHPESSVVSQPRVKFDVEPGIPVALQPLVKPDADPRPPVVPTPDVKPDIQPTPYVTSPGPADDSLVRPFNQLNRSTFDNSRWSVDPGRRSRS